MPGTSYNIEKGFINTLNFSNIPIAIELLYSLSIEEMVYLAKKGAITNNKINDLISEFSIEDAKEIGKIILLTKLTYFETKFLTENESKFLIEIVYFCIKEKTIQDILIRYKNRNNIFYNWFLTLVIKANLYKSK